MVNRTEVVKEVLAWLDLSSRVLNLDEMAAATAGQLAAERHQRETLRCLSL
jgi:hypothetical protein